MSSKLSQQTQSGIPFSDAALQGTFLNTYRTRLLLVMNLRILDPWCPSQYVLIIIYGGGTDKSRSVLPHRDSPSPRADAVRSGANHPCGAGSSNPCQGLPLLWGDGTFPGCVPGSSSKRAGSSVVGEINATMVEQMGIDTKALDEPLVAKGLNGTPLAQITHKTVPVTLLLSGNHEETLRFFSASTGTWFPLATDTQHTAGLEHG